ncbi:MAG: GIY-YIG nuclease family protein [Natronospirillum sp.]|uniref:GIY-YIG nuclease family protein n=1 Tax=Natronospirillum sp. TaxID=2812955 RepID=UPI002600D0CF|nr:GIY-YIG nuclease family protein [Natronospirillum sp.]MCH8550986.1 GIY-YIG nuclease family protein [Natronospirillum sp.]
MNMNQPEPNHPATSKAPTREWVVYMLRCADASLYTGITTDITRRLRQHNGELGGGARYTRPRRPVELAWHCHCASRSLAAKEEARLRRLTRQQKLDLISG